MWHSNGGKFNSTCARVPPFISSQVHGKDGTILLPEQVDQKMWEGAYASGWRMTIRSEQAGKYWYLNTDGGKHTSRSAAVAHEERAPEVAAASHCTNRSERSRGSSHSGHCDRKWAKAVPLGAAPAPAKAPVAAPAAAAATSASAKRKRKGAQAGLIAPTDWASVKASAEQAMGEGEADESAIRRRVRDMFEERYPDGIDVANPAVAGLIPRQRKEFEEAARAEWQSEVRLAYDAAELAVAQLRGVLGVQGHSPPKAARKVKQIVQIL